MPRFQCPACDGPFNVDEQFVGRVVGCPHCGEPLDTSDEQATPAGPPVHRSAGLPPGQPGMVWMQPAPPKRRPRTAVASLLLGLGYWVGSFATGFAAVWSHTGGRQPTNLQDAMRLSQEIAKNPPVWLAPAQLLLVLMGLAGLACAIHALTRPNVKKGMAVAGVILCGFASCCGAADMLGTLLGAG